MRIYEGSPRQDYEEVLRSIGAFVDQRGLPRDPPRRGARRVHRPGHRHAAPGRLRLADPTMTVTKETYTFLDEDIARFLEDSQAPPAHRPGQRRLADGRPVRAHHARHRPLHRRPEAQGRLLLRAGRCLRAAPAHEQRARAHARQLAEFTAEDLAVDDRARARPSAAREENRRALAADVAGRTHGRHAAAGRTCGFGAPCHRQRSTRTQTTAPSGLGGRAHRGGPPCASSSSSEPSIGLLVAAAVIVPLVVLAGLFIWLKLTEEADEEALELEQEAAI